MKKISMAIALLLGMGFFSSCTSDDNEGQTLAPLAGKWDLSKIGTSGGGVETLIDAPQNQSGCERDYIELKLDNTVNEGDYDSTVSPCALTIESGIYSRSHNNLTRVVGEQTKVQDIVNLTFNELKLRDGSGNVEVYIRH